MSNHRPVKDQVDALASEAGLLAAGTEPRRQAEMAAEIERLTAELAAAQANLAESEDLVRACFADASSKNIAYAEANYLARCSEEKLEKAQADSAALREIVARYMTLSKAAARIISGTDAEYETAPYDGAECDGFCLIDDLEAVDICAEALVSQMEKDDE